MNFQQIAEQYPKAWGKLREYSIQDYNSISKFSAEIFVIAYLVEHSRNLYDFFDSEGIIINVVWTTYLNGIDKKRHDYFDWELWVIGECLDSSEVEHPTRPEAEEQAFTKAFSILENKLKGVTEK